MTMAAAILPKRVKVRKHYYRVVLKEDWIEYKGQRVRGLCIGAPVRTIEVYAKQTRRWLISTFMHEVMHAVQFEYRIKLEHQTIHDLEMPFAELMMHNPSLRRHVQLWKKRRVAKSPEALAARRSKSGNALRSKSARQRARDPR